MTVAALLDSPQPMPGIRDRVASYIKVAPDKGVRDLLRDILVVLDKPYDLEWVKDEYGLSPAEFRIITFLAEGKNAAAISEITGTQISTIRAQTHKAYMKMRISNTQELTALLIQNARNA